MWKKWERLKAFTLLECLVALVVVSGSCLVYDGLTRYLHRETERLQVRQQQDWTLFTAQMRAELSGARLVKVEDQRLTVQATDGRKRSFGKAKGGDFRKTDEHGMGYQPMLFDVKEARWSQQGGQVALDLVLKTGERRMFRYAFQEVR